MSMGHVLLPIIRPDFSSRSPLDDRDIDIQDCALSQPSSCAKSCVASWDGLVLQHPIQASRHITVGIVNVDM